MKHATILLFAGLLSAGAASFSTNYPAALKIASETGKPVLLEFTADWCRYCKMMEESTLKEEAVQKDLTNFVTVTIDFDTQRELVTKHKIRGIPAFVILDADGDQVTSTSGFQNASAFTGFLKTGFASTKIALLKKEQQSQKESWIRESLAGVDQKRITRALDEIFADAADHSERINTFARAQLNELAEKNPKLIVSGLNHAKLATRLHVYNLLRNKVDKSLSFDPWAPMTERESAAKLVANKLNAPR